METEAKRGKMVAYLPISQLHHHPKNPRKDIGDITELTESIKKNGIMQNLTVIPGFYRETNGKFFETDQEYTVIIGHRRLEAAKAAGLYEVPCRIYKNLPEEEQILTMLEENMQRNDLTVFEQAQSFQLMLDLGETVDTLSEKTGFAKSTIYHRVNIAKLDPEIVKEKCDDDNFQLTIKDLIELEQIKDIEKREEILKSAKNSNDLRFQAQMAAKQEKLDAVEEKAREILEKTGAQEGVPADTWNGKNLQIFYQDFRDGKDFKLPKDVLDKITEDTLYIFSYSTVKILNPKTKEEKEAEYEEKEPTEWEIKNQKRNSIRQQYSEIKVSLDIRLHEFILSIISGDLDGPDKDEIHDICDQLLNIYLEFEGTTSWEEFYEYMTDGNWFDLDDHEKEKEIQRTKKMPLLHKLLIMVANEMQHCGTLSYRDSTYDKEDGRKLLEAYFILDNWGWTFTKEEQQLVNGTHELYEEPEEEE